MNVGQSRIYSRSAEARCSYDGAVQPSWQMNWLKTVLASLCLLIAGATAHAQTVTTPVNVGIWPVAAAANPLTNKTYVVNSGDNTVTSIDGLTNTPTSISVGVSPIAVAVNPTTNLVYVLNNNNHNGGSVTVINGATNTVVGSAITTGTNSVALAVNPVTNKIYVANSGSGNVTAIDANNSNATTAVQAGNAPVALAVNPVTNEIYVANYTGNSVTIINAASNNSFSTISVGTSPTALAVNPVTNQIFVANFNSSTVSVIAGANNQVTGSAISTGTNPNSIAVDAATNKIYVATSTGVTVIDGTNLGNLAPPTLAAGSSPYAVAVNQVSNQVYVVNHGSVSGANGVTIINGATNSVAASVNKSLNSGSVPGALAINPVTNKIYVANKGTGTTASTVTVIDGATNATATASAGGQPNAVVVNPVTNKIYVANGSGTVTVIDGTGANQPTNIPVGSTPFALDVNPITNKIYVVNQGSNTLSVINGGTNTVNTITLPAYPIGGTPYAVAVNTVTNQVYVVNNGGNGSTTVIDGASGAIINTIGLGPQPQAVAVNPATNRTYFAVTGNSTVVCFDGANNPIAIIPVGNGVSPWAIGVNPVTNTVYVANIFGNNVTVINGNTNAVITTLQVGNNPNSVAVDVFTNKIYVANQNGNSVSVIDGNTNLVSGTLTVGQNPWAVAVNPVTNKIYVPNAGQTSGSFVMSVIDGATGTVTSVPTGSQPQSAAVNPVTNQIYVGNQTSANVTEVNEQQTQTIPITTTIQPLTLNTTASQTPSFAVTTSNTFTSGAPVDNVLYQVDTWQGTWNLASGSSGTYNVTLPTLLPGFHILYAYATDGEEGTSTNTGLQGSPLIGNISAYGFLVAPAGASISPTSLSFSPQTATTQSPAKTVTLTNNGALSMTYSVAVSDLNNPSNNYTISAGAINGCPIAGGTLAVGASCTINVVFSPQSAAQLNATLTVTDNSNGIPGSTQTVSLSGQGTGNADPGISWTAPGQIAYGTQLSVTQLNATTTKANIPADGTLSYLPPVGTVLGAGPHTLTVTFTPSTSGSQVYAGAQLSVQITVTPVTLTVTANTLSSPFGQTPAYTSNYIGFVNGDGVSVVNGIITYTTNPAPNPLTVGQYAIVPNLSGLSAANYVFTAAATQGTLTIAKATPVITWGGATQTLPAITYGTTLASSLNATANTPGGFTYTSGANSISGATVLPVGQQTLTVSFVPTDTTDYNSPTTANASLAVNKATPTVGVTTNGTSTLKYGTPVMFSASVSYTFGIPSGTISFYDAASGATCSTLGTSTLIGTAQTLVSGSASVTTSTIKAGSHTVLGCYGGDSNFLAGGNTVSQVVGQATPALTWNQPAAINYGTALSGAQLNATVANNLPGTFSYNPGTGSVLGAGSQTLNLTFVPADTVDFTNATASVTLVVNQAPPNSQATVTTTSGAGTGPKAMAINPVTNTIYVANVGSANVTVINGTNNSVGTIGVGTQPDAVAVNPVTNQIYVANYQDSSVTAIDGSGNNSPSTITVGSQPTVIAVNSLTNKIYVVNSGSGTVSVIDGNNANAVTPITVGTNPYAVAVNPVTNMIYVTNQGTSGAGGSVSVINGATNAISSTVVDPQASNPYAVSVNAATNKVYVTNLNSNTVTIINAGQSNAVTSISVGQQPWAVAVNEVTNRIYVANYGNGTVTVINANSNNSTTPVTVGTNPDAIAVNPITNQVFVANLGSANFTVIEGANNTATNVGAGTNPVAVAVNPVTDKIYVANNGSGNVSVVDGATNTTSTTATSANPVSVAVNPATNTIYVANSTNPGNVNVINGSTVSSVTVGQYPSTLAVNPLTNTIYTVNLTNVSVINGTNNTATTYNVGGGPNALAVNPITNTVYFTNYNDNTVAVFNGATNTVTTPVGVGVHPDAVAVNPVTNKVYVANIGPGQTLGTVTVVDATTNAATANITVGDWPLAITVNPVTNKIYVANSNLDSYPTPGSVTVIDGITNATTSIPAGIEPYAINVNPITNKIYVANKDGNSVMVIDGATNSTTTLAVGSAPYSIAINPVTNKIYVPNALDVPKNSGNFYLSVIDGATNFVTTLAAGSQPVSAAVNPMTNQVYIANQNSSNIMALTEQQVQTIPITTTIQPLVGNSTANLAPTFTFNATNSMTAAPVNGVYYQIDTLGGTWVTAASQGGGTFTATTAALLPGYHILYAFGTTGEEGSTTITGPQNSPLIGNIAAYGFAEVAQTGGETGANISPSVLNFGNQAKTTTSAAQTATLLNASNATLTFSVSFTGANKSDFAETVGSNGDTCGSLSSHLAPNASCIIAVTFTPTSAGNRNATLTVTDDSNGIANSIQSVSLSGTGTGNTLPGLTWTPPSSITYGTPLASIENATTTVAHVPADGTLSYSPSSGNLGVGPQTLTVTFTPSTSGAQTYQVAQLSVNVTVTPATLTVTPVAATRAYGAPNPTFTATYGGFQNGDTPSVLSGTPSFSTQAGATSNVAQYPITVSQGTLSAANYTFSFATGVNLTVTQATPTINWGPLAPITVGTALSGAQLNATVTITGGTTVPGSFVYNPAAGFVPPSGPNTLSVSFTPTGPGASNFTTASGTTTLEVNQATAVFSTMDTSTQGGWQGVYGSQGYSMAPSSQSLPSYATFALQNQTAYTWVANTTEARALQNPTGGGRTAATWYAASTFSMAVNLTDSHVHQIALYAVDWESAGRQEQIKITDAVTNGVLDTETISGFTNGVYLVWNVSGSVNITITTTNNNANAVMSGIFFATNSTAENVTVKPSAVSLTSGGTQQFTATVTNGTGTPTWTISAVSPIGAASGTVSSTGLYTAPITTTTTTVTVTATSADLTTTGSATVLVLPPSTNYLTSAKLGTARNNFSGWIGMTVTVGSSPVTVTALGRMFAPGNSNTHTVKFVNAATGQDVSGGSAAVPMSGGSTGTFVYVGLPASVTLNANTTYYLVSQETSGQDQWYDTDTAVTTTSIASDTGGVWSSNGTSYNTVPQTANMEYIPLDFEYTVNVTQPSITTQPQSVTISAGSTATFTVAASGGNLTYQWESAPAGSNSFTNISGATSSSYTTPAMAQNLTGTQYMCVVTNTAGSTPSNVATLTVVAALPTTPYVTSFNQGKARNDFTGWVGMSITTGSSPVSVTALGQLYVSGNTGAHTIKIVSASGSQDVPGGSVSVSMSGGTTGNFVYQNLTSPLTLSANTTYYIMAQQAHGGDIWYDDNTTIATTTVAAENSAVYSFDGATYTADASSMDTFGPVSFLYSTAPSQPTITTQPQSQTVSIGSTPTFSVTATGGGLTYQWQSAPPSSNVFTIISGATGSSYTIPATTSVSQSGTRYECVVTNSAGSATSNAATLTVTTSIPTTSYITSSNTGKARNDFSGWIGMSITTASSPITVTALGQLYVSGNSGTHAIKIVTASNSQDVAGSSVTVSMAGGTSGTFAYSTLASPVTLNANTTYYVMAQETQAGDTWYDMNTTISTTSVANETASVYSFNGATYFTQSSANASYGPVSFLYQTALAQPTISGQPQNQTASVGGTATFSVTATGGSLTYQWQSAASGTNIFANIGGATSSSYTTPATTSTQQSGTQYQCVVTNSVGSATSNKATLTVIASLPTTNYVTSYSPGTARNNFTGWIGMSITTGSTPVAVAALGHIDVSGNSGTHTMKIVNASTSQDVPGTTVSVSMSGGTAGSIIFANLSAPVTLNSNTKYYIVAQETNAGDSWYDINASITTTGVAAENAGIYSYDGATYSSLGSASNTFGPVSFLYQIAVTQPAVTLQPQNQTVSVGSTASFSVTATGGNLSYQWQSAPAATNSFTPISGATSSTYTTPATTNTSQTGTQYECVVTNSVGSVTSNVATLNVIAQPSTASYVTSFGAGSLRNNFTGWIGMSFTIGSTPVTVTALGQIDVSGNSATHSMKIVSASNSLDVAGTTVNIPMSGGTAGTIVYANLATSVTLNANTTYYIMAQQTNGGDSWYDTNTMIVTAAGIANTTGSVYSFNGATYFPNTSANTSYGPVSFLYSTAPSAPSISAQPQSQTVSVGLTATFSVTATGGGLTYQWQSAPAASNSFINIGGATSSSYTTPTLTTGQNGMQYMCVVTNSVGSTNSNIATLTVSTALPTTNYVTSAVLGGLRNDFNGWVGMAVTIGNNPIVVTGLGRMVAPGDTSSHALQIVTASGAAVAGASTTLNASGGQSGKFLYSNLTAPVTLEAGTTYYIVSQEVSGGDRWYDINGTTVQTTSVASELSGVWSTDGVKFNQFGTNTQAYVPVDFQYTTEPTAAYVTSIAFNGPTQSNFTGWVGGAITTGSSSVQVTQLGRYYVFGNSGIHAMRIVDASTGTVVSGSQVTVNLVQGQIGTFVYAALPTPVTLSANKSYYILSQETAGGDNYFNFETQVNTTNVVSDISSAASSDGVTYQTSGGTNQMSGPISFIYVTP